MIWEGKPIWPEIKGKLYFLYDGYTYNITHLPDPTSTLPRPYLDPTLALPRPYLDPTSALPRPYLDLTWPYLDSTRP